MNESTPRTDAALTKFKSIPSCMTIAEDIALCDMSNEMAKLERELAEAKEQLEIEHAVETCKKCNVGMSPSWIEGGVCIHCILQEYRDERDQWRKVADELAKSLSKAMGNESTGAWDSTCQTCGISVPCGDLKHRQDCHGATALAAYNKLKEGE